MTDRAEIERLLNKTGRTLKGLPEHYSDRECIDLFDKILANTIVGVAIEIGNTVLHQSDVIELLVGALRDALEKPMQKPLTLTEVNRHEQPVYVEFKDFPSANGWKMGVLDALNWVQKVYQDICNPEFGVKYRFWASRPTDEEREAAAWLT